MRVAVEERAEHERPGGVEGVLEREAPVFAHLRRRDAPPPAAAERPFALEGDDGARVVRADRAAEADRRLGASRGARLGRRHPGPAPRASRAESRGSRRARCGCGRAVRRRSCSASAGASVAVKLPSASVSAVAASSKPGVPAVRSKIWTCCAGGFARFGAGQLALQDDGFVRGQLARAFERYRRSSSGGSGARPARVRWEAAFPCRSRSAVRPPAGFRSPPGFRRRSASARSG